MNSKILKSGHIKLYKRENSKFWQMKIKLPKQKAIRSSSGTKILKEAEKRGLSIQNGMDMLIEQAAESFQIWHNVKPKKDSKLTELLEKQ